MGAHILWKVNIRFICMQAKMGPCMQSILIKARNNFCLTMCACPVPGQGARAVNLWPTLLNTSPQHSHEGPARATERGV